MKKKDKYDMLTWLIFAITIGLGLGFGRGNWDTLLQCLTSPLIPISFLWVIFRQSRR